MGAKRRMRRSIAKVVVVASLGACVVLVASMTDTHASSPLGVVMNVLDCVAIGLNVYFLGKFLRALVWYGRKLATASVGAAWLLLYAGLSLLMFAKGFAECAGGCGYRSVSLTDWLFMLGMAGLGLGFNQWLNYIHSSYTAPARDRAL
jgi:hypothetical protein